MRLIQSFTLSLAMFMTLLPGSASAQVELPRIPDPVPVSLDAGTTAFLVLDIQESNCPRRPACIASLPDVATLLGRARDANMLVVYTGTPSGILPEVAPREGEPIPATMGGDKFFNSNLDQILKGAGITTLLLVGTTAVNAIMNTSFAASARGYTVVVAEDGISADTDFQLFYARYHLLLQNLQNVPLAPRAVTLTRMDMVSF